MPSAYGVSVAAGSAQDRESNNLTLFSLVEQVQLVPGATFPGRLDFEVHSFWEFEPEEREYAHEVRTIVSLNGTTASASEGIHVPSNLLVSGRLRVRLQGLVVLGLGVHRVASEIRRGGGEWRRWRL